MPIICETCSVFMFEQERERDIEWCFFMAFQSCRLKIYNDDDAIFWMLILSKLDWWCDDSSPINHNHFDCEKLSSLHAQQILCLGRCALFFHHQPHKHWILIENSVKMKLITSTQAESGAAQKAESQWQKSYFLPSPRSSCLCMRDTSKPAFDDKHRNVMCARLSFRIIHKDTFNNIFWIRD